MSRFTETRNTIFDEAGITLKQAQLLEYLFLYGESIPYKELAEHFDTTNNAIGRLVSALRKKGMVNRSIGLDGGIGGCDFSEDPIPCDEWEVELNSAAWDLRESFKEWDAWLTENGSPDSHVKPAAPAPKTTPKHKHEPAHWCVVLPVKSTQESG